MSGELRLVSRARLKRDAVRGGTVLLMPEAVLELNEQGAEVLSLCDGTRTLDAVVAAMRARHAPGADPEVVERDVRAFVQRLLARSLLERL